MSTRIRYTKAKDGVSETVKRFQHPTNGARYKVVLNQNDFSFSIVETLSETEVDFGKACNMHEVKKKAKKKLEGLGIEFEGEERDVKEKVQQVTL